MNGKRTGSLAGVVLAILVLACLGGCGQENRAQRAAVGKILQPLGELIGRASHPWAGIVGVVLRLVGTMLEVEYLLDGGGSERAAVALTDELARELRPGDQIVLRDKDGVEKTYELREVKHIPPAARTPRSWSIRYRCLVPFNSVMPQFEARQFGALLNQLAVPWQGRDVDPFFSTVVYGPVPIWQEIMLPDAEQAQFLAAQLRQAGFEVALDH